MDRTIMKVIGTTMLVVVAVLLVLLFTSFTIIRGTLTDSMYGYKCNDGYAYIKSNSKEYYAGAGDLEQWEDKYNVDLELGDRVLVLCDVSPKETSPTEIKILYLIEL